MWLESTASATVGCMRPPEALGSVTLVEPTHYGPWGGLGEIIAGSLCSPIFASVGYRDFAWEGQIHAQKLSRLAGKLSSTKILLPLKIRTHQGA